MLLHKSHISKAIVVKLMGQKSLYEVRPSCATMQKFEINEKRRRNNAQVWQFLQ
jgi:hypothetical protein